MSVDLREIIKVTENEICILNEGKTRHIKTENLFHLPTIKEIGSQKEPQMKVIIANDYALCCGAFALDNPFYHQNRFCFYPIQSFFIYKHTEGFGRLVQSTNNLAGKGRQGLCDGVPSVEAGDSDRQRPRRCRSGRHPDHRQRRPFSDEACGRGSRRC